MSLVPDNRKISTSIEYSPVDNERDHEYLEISLSSASSNHGTGTKPVRTGSGHFDNASSSNRDSTTTRVDQIEVSRSGQNTAGYKGPSIAGWPTAPQKLSNFSISLFLGDIVLVFLPIAFLGSSLYLRILPKSSLFFLSARNFRLDAQRQRTF